MKIVFMGTPDFAVPSLKRLIEEYNVTAILTQLIFLKKELQNQEYP